ncbi:MAG: SRPBCC family protein [Bryobacteraceae bacterium]
MAASTTSAKGVSAVADTADRELVFTRVFDAPRELVFEAWTDPKHIAQWWGPKGFTTTIQEMDVRPGGVWRHVMRGPDGRDYLNKIVFLEVTKPERLVYKHEPEHGSEPVHHQTTVTFADEGGKTRLSMQMLFASAADRKYVVDTYGAVEGANQTLSRLAEHLPLMHPLDGLADYMAKE